MKPNRCVFGFSIAIGLGALFTSLESLAGQNSTREAVIVTFSGDGSAKGVTVGDLLRNSGASIQREINSAKRRQVVTAPMDVTDEALARLRALSGVASAVPVSRFNFSSVEQADLAALRGDNSYWPNEATKAKPRPMNLARKHVPGQILIQVKGTEVKNGRTALERAQISATLAARHGLQRTAAYACSDGTVIELRQTPNDASLEASLTKLAQDSEVIFAEPNYIFYHTTSNNDPYSSYDLSVYYGGDVHRFQTMHVYDAWDIRSTSNQILAILDTGTDYSHTDLASNMWTNAADPINGIDDDGNGIVDDYYGADFAAGASTDPNFWSNPPTDGNPSPATSGGAAMYHGTAVAGIAAARGNNGAGISGIAWTARIMAVKAFSDDGVGNTYSLIRGLDYATTHGARVVNLSLAYEDTQGPTIDPDTYGFGLLAALRRARDGDVTIVMAAGNSVMNTDSTPCYPGAYGLTNGIVVGATQTVNPTYPQWIPNSFNYGRWSVDLGVPTYYIFTTSAGGWYGDPYVPGYIQFSGTSAAAPQVAGCLTLLREHFTNEDAWDIVDRCRMSYDSYSMLDGYYSNSAVMNVRKAFDPRSSMTNASARAMTGNGDSVHITAFRIKGATPKCVILRALGPTLGDYGITSAASDTAMTLYDESGQYVASNDDCGTLSQADRTTLTQNGLTPPSPKESALVVTLYPGLYTFHTTNPSGPNGVVLAEVYDVQGTSTPRLINASHRSVPGSGEQVAIAGLVVTGSKPRRVAVRSLGPTLAAYGVQGTMTNPKLELFNGTGARVALNKDWRHDENNGIASGVAYENRLKEFGLAPGSDTEPIIVATLDPGYYYAMASAESGANGVVSIEWYEY